MSPWVGALLGFGVVLSPRLTRLIAGIFTTVAVADVLQLGYEATVKKAE